MGKFGITEFILILAIIIGIFFLARSINLWYFKINRRIELQEETNRLLKSLVNQNISSHENKNFSKTAFNNSESDVNNPETLNKLISEMNKKG